MIDTVIPEIRWIRQSLSLALHACPQSHRLVPQSDADFSVGRDGKGTPSHFHLGDGSADGP